MRGAAVVVAVVAGAGVLFAAFALGPFTWAGELWREAAPAWPGEGYGFAATAGAVLPVTLAATVNALGRASKHWSHRRVPALLFIVAALPVGAVSLMVPAIAAHSMRPKRSHRGGYCSTAGEYCWISMQYPYVWLVGLAATVLSALLLMSLHQAYEKWRGAARP
ncbi:hypothetical protein [Streptomyces sp. NPDC020747]|uniref:hypothetical protein n=1 Tax=Streptomyces sp. NPDC020747 TaxID=3365086 RepID=UPI0037AC588F